MSLMGIVTLGAAVLLTAGSCALLIRRYLQRIVDKRISAYQNDLVARHVEEVQNIYKQMRGWRHDYHSHIQAMQAFRALEQDDKLDEYLVKLNADLVSVDTLVKSGNVMIDAILNSKLSLCKSRCIETHVKAVVPSKLTISEIDLCVLVGNLLDNAIEANLRCEAAADRFLRVYINLKGEQLYISITNASGRRARNVQGRYMSLKSEPNHGFGLARVDRIIGKYDGYIRRGDEEGAFTTEVLLPL